MALMRRAILSVSEDNGRSSRQATEEYADKGGDVGSQVSVPAFEILALGQDDEFVPKHFPVSCQDHRLTRIEADSEVNDVR